MNPKENLFKHCPKLLLALFAGVLLLVIPLNSRAASGDAARASLKDGDDASLDVAAAAASSGAGTLDPSFNGNGIFSTPPAASLNINDVVVQRDGKPVMVGEVSGQIIVIRLTDAGMPDHTFGSVGIVIIDLAAQGYSGAVGQAIRAQEDGKLIIGAYAAHTQTLNDWIILRLNSDGTLDSGFAGDGIMPVGAASDDVLTDLAIDTNGQAVATGAYTDSAGWGISVVRLTSTGQLDNSFDNDGIWGTPSDSQVINPQLGVQEDGKLLVAGDVRLASATSYDFFVIRLMNNGTVDTTFALVGSVHIEDDSGEESLNDMLVDSNGSIVLVGKSDGVSEVGVAIVRLLSTGALDSSFNDDGLLLIDINNTQDSSGRGVARQADGKLIIVGNADQNSPPSGTHHDSFTLRLTPDGELDSTFAEGGIMQHDVGLTLDGQSGHLDVANAVAMQPDGKIVLVGRADTTSGTYGYLMRLQVSSTVYLPMIVR